MMRSLFAGVSGLRNHQTRMDVIGNNISNVNTVGFKAGRVTFQDVLSQTLQGASAGGAGRGGTNPIQVGLGVGLASIDTIFTDGSFQPTGKQTDLSIQGNGFFILTDGQNQVYTRAGSFDFDNQGNFLVPGTGFKVSGWMADANGMLDTTGSVTSIQIPVGAAMAAKPSSSLVFRNNLSADALVGASVPTSIDIYDSLGQAHVVDTTFYKIGANKWLAETKVPTAQGVANSWQEITFDSYGIVSSPIKTLSGPPGFVSLQLSTTADSTSGPTSLALVDNNGVLRVFSAEFTESGGSWRLNLTEQGVENPVTSSIDVSWDGINQQYTFSPANVSVNGGIVNLPPVTVASGAAIAPTTSYSIVNYNSSSLVPVTVTLPSGTAANLTLDVSSLASLTQYGGGSTVKAVDQDGYPAGTLDTTSIDPNGIIVGRFTNGQSKNLAQVALATFNNPTGLIKVGESLYAQSTNSGVAQTGPAGSGGRGSFNPGSLEMANVDLAEEFSNMIITQRGFQANSKIITVTDEMLQELANLRR